MISWIWYSICQSVACRPVCAHTGLELFLEKKLASGFQQKPIKGLGISKNWTAAWTALAGCEGHNSVHLQVGFAPKSLIISSVSLDMPIPRRFCAARHPIISWLLFYSEETCGWKLVVTSARKSFNICTCCPLCPHLLLVLSSNGIPLRSLSWLPCSHCLPLPLSHHYYIILVYFL